MLGILRLWRKVLRVINKVSSYFLVQILKLEVRETKNINGINLTINALEKGGRAYFSKHSYKDVVSPFFRIIQSCFNPDIVLDIGANYGFTSSIFARVFKNAEIIAIEPSAYLCKYIEQQKEQNQADNMVILRAICDCEAGVTRGFAINPLYSQDNRVNAPSDFWKQEQVITTSIDDLLEKKAPQRFTFIKIDTQGFEESVFGGARQYLRHHSNWLIKTEFCPFLMIKQGKDPRSFLRHLIEEYDVVDYTDAFCFKSHSIMDIFRHKLNPGDVDSFLPFIRSHDHSGNGWTDLLVKKKDFDLDSIALKQA